MTVSLRSLRDDAWYSILRTIKRGDHPTDERLTAALKRQEDTVPLEARLYIAKLLSGEIDRRGRPTDKTLLNAALLVEQVAVCRDGFSAAKNPQTQALTKVAVEHCVEIDSLIRKYRRAIALCRGKLDPKSIYDHLAVSILSGIKTSPGPDKKQS